MKLFRSELHRIMFFCLLRKGPIFQQPCTINRVRAHSEKLVHFEGLATPIRYWVFFSPYTSQ